MFLQRGFAEESAFRPEIREQFLSLILTVVNVRLGLFESGILDNG